MKQKQQLVSGPFGHEKVSISRTMGLVMLALLPATAYGLYQFGWPAIFIFLITLLGSLGFEAASLRMAGKPVRPFLLDGSALLTGWLLAMSLPPWAPWWLGLLGAFLAIVVGKQVFGGIGQNLFNPAMVARVALLISFPLEMTTWLPPQPLGAAGSPGLLDSLAITFGLGGAQIDAVSSASLLGHVKTELGRGTPLSQAMGGEYDPLQLALGAVPGSLGETSALLVLLGGLFLMFKKIISWHIPLSMLGTLAALAALFHGLHPEHYPGALYHVLAGSSLLGAFFIATDLVTSPVTRRGQLLFGAGCGALVYIIRTWAGYPEGVGFAVLLMNAMTPLIDHYVRPRIYGRDRKGEPLHYRNAGDDNE
jgi:electron transport complex protein RnfD